MAEPRRIPGGAAGLALVFVAVGVVLAVQDLARLLPPARWWPALIWPDPAQMAQVVAADSLLPRLAMALLCGAAMGLSGALAQVALRNPLAAPDTLGVGAGASLALAAATLYAPGLLAGLGREAVAASGGVAGLAVVLALTWRGGLQPVAVALTGLAVGLYIGSVGGVLAVLNTRQLTGLFVWSAGSLVQLGWDGPARLAVRLLLAGVVTAALGRPLRLLDLPDAMSRGLGVPVPLVRLLALGVSIALAASVTGAVGTIGFLGLVAPALARLCGGPVLVGAPLLGAGLLAMADGLVGRASEVLATPLPTGAATALAGMPVLLWLLTYHVGAAPAPLPAPGRVPPRSRRPDVLIVALAATVLGVAVLACVAGPGMAGWTAGLGFLGQRLPRVAAAAVAGVLLGVAGTLLQRVLDNPMASPEVLGIGTGTAAGALAALWLGWGGVSARLGAGLAGAGVVGGVLLLFARGPAGPGRVVLAGIAVASALQAGVALLLATGDPRAEAALAWLSGSTYGVDPAAAIVACMAGIVLLLPLPPLLRWIDLLSLGPDGARALGTPVAAARAVLLALAAAMTAVATLLAGPLSFVGLMAPHLARLLGLYRAGWQVMGAALTGAAVMIVADWMGRTALFPYEIPAGLVASLIGGPALLLALARRPA